MAAERTNLNVIAHACREAMAKRWRVELLLTTGASISGTVTEMPEDLARKSEATSRGTTDRSHLLIVLDGGAPFALDRVREVRPAL